MKDKPAKISFNNFSSRAVSLLNDLLSGQQYKDVTLIATDGTLSLHQAILSSTSKVFRTIFQNNPCPHPFVFMRNTNLAILQKISQYIYTGEYEIDTLKNYMKGRILNVNIVIMYPKQRLILNST